MRGFEGVASMSNELVVSSAAEAYMPVLNVQAAVYRQSAITQYVKDAFIKDRDYGVIPGVDKPSLFKPGAEKLLTFFGLAAQFVEVETVEDWTGVEHGGEAFFMYRYRCDMYRNGVLLGSGIGSCNSWESKYRYRDDKRKCPNCGKPSLMRSKFPPKGRPNDEPGWWCNTKKDGCGTDFAYNDTRITEQKVGKIPNPDPADVVNTIDKMAQKRALVAGCLITVNASDYFTQDVEDMVVDGNYIDGAYTVTVLPGKGTVSGNGNGNGGGGEHSTATGQAESQQRIPATVGTVPTGTGNGAEWLLWTGAADAKVWAVECGACDNPFEANNSFANVVTDKFGGKFTTGNKTDVFKAFHEHQMQKLEKKERIAREKAAATNPFEDESADSHETGLPSD
jgi:hypothetical protein